MSDKARIQEHPQDIKDGRGKPHAPDPEGNPSATIPATEPATAAEVKTFLDESIGAPEGLSVYELQRRNELEKLLMARIRRKRVESELIHIDTARKTIDAILEAIVSGLESLPDKCAPLVAAETKKSGCRQIIEREVNTMRESVSNEIKQLPERLCNG